MSEHPLTKLTFFLSLYIVHVFFFMILFPLQEKDLQTLKQFILKKRPQVVVVSAECRETVGVVDDIKMCIAELEQENQIPTISVEALDGEVARVFMSSPRSEVCLIGI